MSPYDAADYRALLAGVLAHPADDLPRLVLADWLTENGEEEYGEFIRVQCELAGTPTLTETERDELVKRERELWGRMVDDKTAFRWCRPFGGDTLLSAEEPKAYDRRDRGKPSAGGAVVRRGFVAEVTAPLATLYGGECPTCADADVFYNSPDALRDDPCPACNGTGRTVGLLPRLVREQPVEVVRVTDREPYQSEPADVGVPYSGAVLWACNDGGHGGLHERIFCRLKGYTNQMQGAMTAHYPTREAADAALSAALLAWAKGVKV